MKNAFIFFLLLFSCGLANGQKVLKNDYFLFTDVGFNKLHQSKDTLYVYKCHYDFSCFKEPIRHYKINSSESIAEYTILKLERLDSIPLTTNPYPEDRFSILTLKNINDNTLTFILEAKRFTREEIGKTQIKLNDFEGKFGFTYYSKEYLAKLDKRKQITTKKEVEEILSLFKNPEYQKIIQQYHSSKVIDMYNAGLMYELWHKAVIDSGYNPHGSSHLFNELMK